MAKDNTVIDCSETPTWLKLSIHMQDLCRHLRPYKGLFCDDCLHEKILESQLSLKLCQHAHFQINCELCKEMFLSLCMGTHDRLGNLDEPPETFVSTTTEIFRGSQVITTRVFIKNRHNVLARVPSDVLRLIWDLYRG